MTSRCKLSNGICGLGIVAILLLTCCNNLSQGEKSSKGKGEPTSSRQPQEAVYPELVAGEFDYKGDTAFGEIIELKGKQIVGDTGIFKTFECSFIMKDSLFIMTRGFDPIFLFHFPSMMNFSQIYNIGNGPNEFNYPEVIESVDSTELAFVVDQTNYRKLFRLTNDFKLVPIRSPFNSRSPYAVNNISHLGNSRFLYTEYIFDQDFMIQECCLEGDSVYVKDVYNVALPGLKGDWRQQMGRINVNVKSSRLVYAYAYYRRILFMDLDGKTVRVINYVGESGFDDKTLLKADALLLNKAYYGSISSNDEYVFISYTGKSSVDWYNGHKKGDNSIYIEQYDWSGNPIRKYKLDYGGAFFIDKEGKRIYLIASYFDEPFFIYDLPK